MGAGPEGSTRSTGTTTTLPPPGSLPDVPSSRSLPRPVVVLVGGAALVVVLAGLQAMQTLVGPAFLALTLVLTISPLQQRLLRRGVPAIVALYALIIGMVMALALSVASLVSVLPIYADQFQGYYEQGLDELFRVGVTGQVVSDAVSEVSPSSIFGFATTFLQGLLDGVTSVTTVVVLLAVILLFLVVDALASPQRVAAASVTHGPLLAALLEFTAGVRRYWLITTVFGAIVAALDVGALLLLGVPLALTWGLLAFMIN